MKTEKSSTVADSTDAQEAMSITNGLENTKMVKVADLKQHPLSEKVYHSDQEMVRLMKENIKINGLINKIIINKDNEVLSGTTRMLALRLLGIEEVEVYVKDINKGDELDFIISSNVQREKTIKEIANEINSLFEKYSPGQGKRGEGINTIELISSITGHSTYKISSIRRVSTTDPLLIGEVSKGKLSLNAATKRCEAYEKVKAEAKYEGESPQLNPPEPKKDELVCPCCGQPVKRKSSDFMFIKFWHSKIKDYVESLKAPAEAA